MFRSVYKDVDGERYFVIKTDIKNIGGDRVTSDFIGNVKVQFSSKYNYTLKAVDIKRGCEKMGLNSRLHSLFFYMTAEMGEKIIDKSYNKL